MSGTAQNQLLDAARKVLAGLNARIDAAHGNAVPLFDGIADLHDAIGAVERQAKDLPLLALPPELRPDAIVALNAIAHRRVHQDKKWGGTAHDDEHIHGELAKAGAAYAWFGSLHETLRQVALRPDSHLNWILRVIYPSGWVFGWKRESRRQDLIDAAALIVAEIERLDRADETAVKSA